MFVTGLLILMVTLFAFKKSFTVLPIGSPLPKGEVKMHDIKDKMVSMKDATLKNGLLVMFSCNTCPYVIKNQQRTKAISEYALKNNIGVILVNSNEAQRTDDDSFDAMKSYAKEQGYKWYYVLDKNSQVADAFGASRTPECYLFNKDLKLAYHGAIDDNPTDASNVKRAHLQEAINQLVAGKEIAVTESRSVGCSIKRKD
ncbi:MAG: thioredoxin family protein [Chitinophagaceae bacterium]|nr:thioredoxin family protein [Chitinophagaceae bacterium]